MPNRRPFDNWTSSLLAAAGLVPIGCAGHSSSPEGTAEKASGGAASHSTPPRPVGDSGSGASSGEMPSAVGGTGFAAGAAGMSSGTSFGGDGGAATEPAGAGGASAGAVATNRFPCVHPVSLGSHPSGYYRCNNGMIHRAAISQCVSVEEHPDPGPSGSLELDECTRDAECTTRAHGFCGQLDDIHPRNSCFYGCIVDADCGGGEICLCGVDPAAHLTSPAPVGTCVPADCTSDSDCLPGFHCALYDANPSCFSHAFSCQRLGDACGGDVDCDNGQVCTLGDGDPLGLENMLRSCAEPRCAVGRPFLVANEVRAATAIRRSDWTAPLTELRLEGMSAVLASRLAAEWTRAGQLEHASIAAFARFVFELLALGAPADLVADATRAMADETEHARTCFAFASSFRTRRVGPSTLDVSGALDGVSFPSAVRSAVIEGCIGETLAAIEAEEASERALEPTIKSALRRIAEDERRHAALAWRFVRWALDQGDSKLACLVEDTFERAALECRDDSPGVDHDVPSDADDAELLEFGVLPCRMRRTLRSNAFAAVIGPCARALLQCVSLDRRFAPLAPPRRTLEPRS